MTTGKLNLPSEMSHKLKRLSMIAENSPNASGNLKKEAENTIKEILDFVANQPENKEE